MKTTAKLSILILIFFITFQFPLNALAQGVSISETTSFPYASAILDVQSTDKGMLVPRVTQAQRDAISTPATGLLETHILSEWSLADGLTFRIISPFAIKEIHQF